MEYPPFFFLERMALFGVVFQSSLFPFPFANYAAEHAVAAVPRYSSIYV